MQFQVPQFIDTEDKIVGPFSLKQFAYVGVAGILSAILYFFGQLWLWVIGSIFIFGIALAFAFVRVGGRSFANLVVSAFNFYWKPQTYIWKPEPPAVQHAQEKVSSDIGRSGLEDILAKSRPLVKPVVKPVAVAQPVAKPVSRATASAGAALQKSWEKVQTGAAFSDKTSDKQFEEKKMAERYQIFRRIAGDQNAAKRVDYR